MKTLFWTSFALIFLFCLAYYAFDKPRATQKQLATIYVNIGGEPLSLNPTLSPSLDYSTPLLSMVFDGLTRLGPNGSPHPSLAHTIEVSSDNKTYTFHLRDALWSNGTNVTAHDVVYSWKKVLTPDYPAPAAQEFYPIKNAQNIKKGLAPIDSLGVYAKDDATLVVELEYPCPYFLELTAMPFFYPISKEADLKQANWGYDVNVSFVSNGPFLLKKWKHSDTIEVIKNPSYWDAAHVRLDKIVITMLEENTALAMFQSGSLHWVGSPTSTILSEAMPLLKSEKKLGIAPAAGTHYYLFNINRAPFNNKSMRKAFAYSLNRESIVHNLIQGEQIPATTMLPPGISREKEGSLSDNDCTLAKHYFQEALKEMGISKNELPPITLTFCSWERNEKTAQAIQQQWYKVLDVSVSLQTYERNLFLEKRSSQDYQICSGSWYCTFRDPLSFLEQFDQGAPTFNPTWKNNEYTSLLVNARNSFSILTRNVYLDQAEKLLAEEMPLIPIYHNTFSYLKDPNLKDVYLSEVGVLDFKWAHLDETQNDLETSDQGHRKS